MHTLLKATVAIALGAALGGAGAWGTNVKTAHASVAAKNPGSADMASGNQETAFRIDFSPASVISSSGSGEQLDLDVTVTSRHATPLGVKYTAFVVDDRGKLITQVSESAMQRLARKDDESVAGMKTPKNLADGYYMLRVIAVGTDGTNTTTLESAYPWLVSKGKITPVTEDEWYQKSRANQG